MRLLSLLAAILAAQQALAEPAVVYSIGGKFDASFNQAAWVGAERFRTETGQGYAEFEPESVAQFEQALRRFARAGNDPVVAIGFLQADAVTKVAAEFPDRRFTIIDMVAEGPNVQSVVFREHEGAYLAGLMAAMASRTGRIGFVGGMDIPLIRRFACAYAQGARSVNPAIEVYVAMTGDTPAAFADPVRGAEIARGQIDRGADVVMQAAGGTGVGVLQAAAEAGVLGIGTDSNQNGLHPGHVLTSVLKRIDVAVHGAFTAAQDGSWKPGVRSLGLAEGGIGIALDEHNRPLVTPRMAAALREASDAIATGRIRVHDLYTDGPCPWG
ncbi:MAG: BMP family ABC transporter substrate-binding protein [Alphaproteobacteria bacterium]|nr:MAG: BMP family ABC transporter substrate-binding protein [Alphaproteobacteria bacterium]